MSHVFISYARKDQSLARQIKRALGKARHAGWMDVDDLLGGLKWRPAIDKALRSARAVVVLLSPAASASEYVTFEWSFALGAGVKVVPVLIKKTKLHPRLAEIQHVNFTGRRRRWSHLVKQITARRQGDRPATAAPAKRGSIFAEFDLEDGDPVVVEESYRIWLGVRRVPRGTKRVTYEILDEEFEDNKWTADSSSPDFGEWITSYGDILITAKGTGEAGAWSTSTTLAEALRRGHGKRPPRKIREALDDIEEN
jgi:hypothetical protein